MGTFNNYFNTSGKYLFDLAHWKAIGNLTRNLLKIYPTVAEEQKIKEIIIVGKNGGWRCRSPPEKDAASIDPKQDGPGPRDRPAGAFFEPGSLQGKIKIGPPHFPDPSEVDEPTKLTPIQPILTDFWASDAFS